MGYYLFTIGPKWRCRAKIVVAVLVVKQGQSYFHAIVSCLRKTVVRPAEKALFWW